MCASMTAMAPPYGSPLGLASNASDEYGAWASKRCTHRKNGDVSPAFSQSTAPSMTSLAGRRSFLTPVGLTTSS